MSEIPLTDDTVLDPEDLLAAAQAGSLEDMLWALELRVALGWDRTQIAQYILRTVARASARADLAFEQLAIADAAMVEATETITRVTARLKQVHTREARSWRGRWAVLRAWIRSLW